MKEIKSLLKEFIHKIAALAITAGLLWVFYSAVRVAKYCYLYDTPDAIDVPWFELFSLFLVFLGKAEFWLSDKEKECSKQDK